MTAAIPKLEVPTLSANGSHDAGVLAIQLHGTADADSRAELETFMRDLHTAACDLKVQRVVVDLRELEFMNSSSFKAFVNWLAKIQDLPSGEQYRIQFRSNPNLHWQRRSLTALSCFAIDLVTIET